MNACQINLQQYIAPSLHMPSQTLQMHEADATLILPGLWLGNCQAALDSNFMHTKQIGCVINATDSIPSPWNVSNIIFDMRDEHACEQDLMRELLYCAHKVHEYRSRGIPVLVHCKRGHHRSAGIVVLYLIRYHHLTLKQAIDYVKMVRPTTFMRMTCVLKTIIRYMCA